MRTFIHNGQITWKYQTVRPIELVLVIAWFGGQLRINFLSKF